jgi:hypothetical protein
MMDSRSRERHDAQLRQLAHDVQDCLHVISMAVRLLKDARDDDRRFDELCGWIDAQRRQATDLVTELLTAARCNDGAQNSVGRHPAN